MDPHPLTQLCDCPAPAKLNLFLHVTGRRPDGYHLLQSAFRMIDLADRLSFTLRSDGLIRRVNDVPGVPTETDLVIRAARLLREATATRLGADITVCKRIPMGGGLGGGSSDAATTLIALNRLWGTRLRRVELAALGLRLGADVPFFIHGRTAFVEGIGERMETLSLTPTCYVVLSPGVEIPTREIFQSEDLTRDSEPIKISDFVGGATRNDLQAVACRLYPEVLDAIEWLSSYAPARMTGSGSCIFAEFDGISAATEVVAQCPAPWKAWVAGSVDTHPLHDWLAD